MKGQFPLDQFKNLDTPFYYYDTCLLQETLDTVKLQLKGQDQFKVHYALKANVNSEILQMIRKNGFGADCVSGGEIRAAIQAGFKPENIVFAGVGKSDWEIELGLDLGIFCFNVESIPELEIINELALNMGKRAQVCLRINPNVKANTHANIATGQAENKFGISLHDLDKVMECVKQLKAIDFVGLHFHIGSQILDMADFRALCNRVNELLDRLEGRGIRIPHINVGGGLGIDYAHPNRQAIPNFESYFDVYDTHLRIRSYQTLHFELGRSLVGQCGSLISRVLYVKEGTNKKFAILDAGMNDLIRPALYQAYHKIENLSSDEALEAYDVVGPVCESSDVFGKSIDLNKVSRGDFMAIRSAGAYGEVMASTYNCRSLPNAYTSDEFI
ncbi:diaminopimelate decarboxylase [Bacteroides coprosuis DSM 18011]|uniref:Diaminopimelate decarboxylase n=1 Tax=Bacteroides coprosuis DSM 18011 TaxID=679937 RepID=F3ZUQ0_9BACE|nr:diaminopimelate decarboxylase [Bacteroides coprosuis]EGJ71215.1 diaminopimelate decarboxylase [Bacteroides coprosuis DSM 18011]